jgi:AAA domain
MANEKLSREEIEKIVERATANGLPAKGSANGASLITQCAADVTPEPIEWLWRQRIALGKLALIAGEAGLGKSQVSIAIAAAVTTGDELPCGEGRAPQGNVIILSAEDGVADTIVPRLMAAGADRKRVQIVRAVKEPSGRRGFNLAGDLELLEKAIADCGEVRLIIIDPISSYLGPKVDSHVNAAVRGVLEPMSEMAARLRVAIVAITHPPKGTGTAAINRFIGSIAFVAAARSAYIVVRDPDDETRRLFLPAKNNLAPKGCGLAFRPEQRLLDDPAKGIGASSVVWEPEPVTMTADQALQATDAQAGGQAPAGAEAEDLLLDLLGSNAVPVTDVKAEAKAAGIAWASVRRAKVRLGVIAERDGFGSEGKWLWRLPAPSAIGAHFPIGAHSQNVSTFGENEHLRSDVSPKVLTSTKDAHPFKVSTFGENEHLWGREGGAHQPSQPNGKGGADLLRDMNGAGIKRRNDMEDYPLAPDGTPDDPEPEWQRGSPEPKHPAGEG